MELSLEQTQIFDKYVAGQNIFITGPGGSGKTALIRLIYTHALNSGQDISVCALTGCAALLLNCNAKTIHSWAGIGIGLGSIEDNVNKIMKSPYKKKNWKNVDILVIDEVSMMSMKLFDMLDSIGKAVRRNNRPFGGIQVIFSGDFYQLPPVGKQEEPDTCRFCFESQSWDTVFPEQIELVKIFRQSDEKYCAVLNQIREGVITRKTVNLLMGQIDKVKPDDLFIEPTKLFPRRNQVDLINQSNISQLKTDEKLFRMSTIHNLPITEKEIIIRNQYSIENVDNELDYLKNNLICDEEIRLKIGAQVMCVVNSEFLLDDGTGTGVCSLCNGSQGIITKFTKTGSPVIRVYDINGVPKEVVITPYIWKSDKIPGIGISQIPLILAWALTIHKSQGSTIEYAEIDIGSNIFEDGQTYVALSRVKSLNGLYLTAFDHTRIRINNKVKEFYRKLKEKNSAPTPTPITSTPSTSSTTKTIPLTASTKTVLTRTTDIPLVIAEEILPTATVVASNLNSGNGENPDNPFQQYAYVEPIMFDK